MRDAGGRNQRTPLGGGGDEVGMPYLCVHVPLGEWKCCSNRMGWGGCQGRRVAITEDKRRGWGPWTNLFVMNVAVVGWGATEDFHQTCGGGAGGKAASWD